MLAIDDAKLTADARRPTRQGPRPVRRLRRRPATTFIKRSRRLRRARRARRVADERGQAASPPRSTRRGRASRPRRSASRPSSRPWSRRCSPRRRSAPGSPASSPRSAGADTPQSRRRRPTTGVPSLSRGAAMSAYAAATPAAYQQQSIMTASPGPARGDALRRRAPLPPAGGRGDARGRPPAATEAAPRARRSSTSCYATLDMERGGEIAEPARGHLRLLQAPLIEARIERDAGEIDKVARAPGRAARGLGADRA